MSPPPKSYVLSAAVACMALLVAAAAANAGVAPGMKLVAVNGRRWNAEVLHSAIQATAKGAALELLVENAEYFKTCRPEYSGGERFPWLERIPGRPDVLSELIRARAPSK